MKQLHNRELIFMLLVYDNAPLTSGALSSLAKERLAWERTTAYTVLRRLSDDGFLKNEGGTVTPLVSRETLLSEEFRTRLLPLAGDNAATLLDALLSGNMLSDKEARALKRVIDAHRVKKANS